MLRVKDGQPPLEPRTINGTGPFRKGALVIANMEMWRGSRLGRRACRGRVDALPVLCLGRRNTLASPRCIWALAGVF